MTDGGAGEQLELLRTASRRRRPKAPEHLAGARVRARFAGTEVDGFVVERRAASEHAGRLTPLRRVASAEPVLTPQVLAAARGVADACAGSLADVLRLAVP